MREILNTYTVPELKAFIRQTNIRGYSNMTKGQLLDLMTHPDNVGRFSNIRAKGQPMETKRRPTQLKVVEGKIKAKPGNTLRDQWLASRMAKQLARAFPKQKAVAEVAWTVAGGKKLRPGYAEGSELYDKALDVITEKFMS